MAEHINTRLRRLIGERVRALRMHAGIPSQERLAELAGVHRTYIGRLERGESGVTVEALATISAAMGVTLSEFFGPFETMLKPDTPRKRPLAGK